MKKVAAVIIRTKKEKFIKFYKVVSIYLRKIRIDRVL